MKAEIKIGSSVLNISLLDSITIYSDEGVVLYASAAPEKKKRKKKEVEPQTDLFDLLNQQTVEVIPNPEPKIEVVEPKTDVKTVLTEPGEPMPEAPALDLDEFEPVTIEIKPKTKEIRYKAFDGRTYVWPERGCVPLRIED